MEERKRPAGDDESAPPTKRQATSVNGASKPHVDADMPWQDDLEVSITLTVIGISRLSLISLPRFESSWANLFTRVALSEGGNMAPDAGIQT